MKKSMICKLRFVVIGFSVLFSLIGLSSAAEATNITLAADLSPQLILTPNFPDLYENDLVCNWLITTQGENQIELKFTVFDTEPEYDTLTIYDGENEKAQILQVLQGKLYIPSVIISSTGKLFLKFVSDDSKRARGFRAQYRIALPSKVNITSVIQACLADTTITNEVYNFDTVEREVEFEVILPQKAFITKFFMELDGEEYVGSVERKEEVMATYEKLEVKGISMGYVRSTKDLAKTFRTGVMLKPGKTVKFEIVYQQLLQRRLGRYTNTFILSREFLIHELNIDIYLCARSDLTFVQVPPIEEAGEMSFIGQARFLGRKDFSPPGVNVTKERNVAHISYRSNGRNRSVPVTPERDVFVLHYDVNRDSSGTLSVIGGEYFATFFAPVSPNLNRRIVFVLDVSGSMAGNKIEQVKIAMNNILSRLSRRDSFNIVQFESVIRTWKSKGLVIATPEAKKSAQEYVDGFDPEGKTNINEALMKGLSLLDEGTRPTARNRRVDVNAYRDFVFFLGDGKPTVGVRNPDAILRAVKNANKKGFGINAIGFGKNVDVKFLQRLTRDNIGKWRIIHDDEDSHFQIQNFIAELGVPIFTDVTFTYSPDQVIYTTERSDLVLVNGGEIGVFGRLQPNLTDESLDVTITGRTFKRVSSEYKLPLNQSMMSCDFLGGEGIDEFAARGYGIAKLEEAIRKMREETDPDLNEKLTEEATNIALEFDLVSLFTFLVVRKPNKTKEEDKTDPARETDGKEGGEAGSLVVPLPDETKPWVFEGDPHFIVALGHNITVCFTWNGTDGEIYNLLSDRGKGIFLNGMIKYGPQSTHKSRKSECNQDDMMSNMSPDGNKGFLLEESDHACNREIESYFVELGFVFPREKIKIKVTPRNITILDERHPKHILVEEIPASDDVFSVVKGNIGIEIYNITKVHSFVNITLNRTATFVINMKRGRNLPPDKNRPSLIDHMDMDIVGHNNFSPHTEGLFGIFPKNAHREVDEAKKSRYPTARLRRPGKANLLLYRKNQISVDKISISDPYSKVPLECWFTYEETSVTGREDEAFRVESIFGLPYHMKKKF